MPKSFEPLQYLHLRRGRRRIRRSRRVVDGRWVSNRMVVALLHGYRWSFYFSVIRLQFISTVFYFDWLLLIFHFSSRVVVVVVVVVEVVVVTIYFNTTQNKCSTQLPLQTKVLKEKRQHDTHPAKLQSRSRTKTSCLDRIQLAAGAAIAAIVLELGCKAAGTWRLKWT